MKEVWRTSSKIMVVVMLCASVLSASIGGMVLYQSSRVVEKNVYRNLEMTAENYAKVFSDSTEQVEITLESYLSAIWGTMDLAALYADPDGYLTQYQEQTLVPLTQQFASDNKDRFLGIYFDFDPYLSEALKDEDETYGVWFLDKDLSGTIQRESMEQKLNFYPENEKMGWYYDAVHAKAGVWSKPYVDIYTGYYMISYTAPVYDGEKLIGVAGIDMTFESVREIIEQFRVFDTGYAFLLSSDYDVIVTPGDRNLGRETALTSLNPQYQRLIDIIEEGKDRIAVIGKPSSGRVLSYGEMSTGYLFVIDVKSEEIFKDLNYIRTLVDTMILLGIILCAAVAYFLGRYIARPMEEAQRKIHRILCQDLQKDGRRVSFSKNSEGQKLLDEIEGIRDAIEKHMIAFKENLYVEELAQDKLSMAAGRLEIILARLADHHETSTDEDGLAIFHIEEGLRLLGQIHQLIKDLTYLHKQNSSLASMYYLDSSSAQNDEKNKFRSEKSCIGKDSRKEV